MKLSRFIASRLSVNDKTSYSSFIVNVATIAVAISLAIMILSISISQGYDKSIRKKIFGFWGHIQITDGATALGLEPKPIPIDSLFETPLDEPWINHINYYALKTGLIKTDESIHGILLKGVTDDMDWSQFSDFLVEGDFPKEKNDVLISTELANQLQVEIGDKLRIYFIQKPLRARALVVSGLYNTNMVEMDEQLIFGSIKNIQQLNGWDENQIEGAELFVDYPDYSNEYARDIRRKYDGYNRQIISIEQSQPELFDWLNFLKTNQWIILLLMAIVAIVNMVSMLLVLILERSKMIGILKALGAPFSTIQQIFIYKALQIILYGLAIGNMLGLGFCFLQQKFKLIKLDPEMYFLSAVPIHLNMQSIVLLNIATAIIILSTLYFPTLFIRKINPIQVLRYE